MSSTFNWEEGAFGVYRKLFCQGLIDVSVTWSTTKNEKYTCHVNGKKLKQEFDTSTAACEYMEIFTRQLAAKFNEEIQ